MKKIIVLIAVLLIPMFVSAGFFSKFTGMVTNDEVMEEVCSGQGSDYFQGGVTTGTDISGNRFTGQDLCLNGDTIDISIGERKSIPLSGGTLNIYLVGANSEKNTVTIQINGQSYSGGLGDTFTVGDVAISLRGVYTSSIPVPSAHAELAIAVEGQADYLAEYYCSGGWLTYEAYRCPGGCTNRACLPEINLACSDTDGHDYYTKGRVVDANQEGVDECLSSSGGGYTYMRECTGSNCYVHEYYCMDNGRMNAEVVKCDKCLDGACIKTDNCFVTVNFEVVKSVYATDRNDCYKKTSFGSRNCDVYESHFTIGRNILEQYFGEVGGDRVNLDYCEGGCVDTDDSPDFLANSPQSPINPRSNPSFYKQGVGKGTYVGSDESMVYGTTSHQKAAKPSPYFYSVYYDHCQDENQLNEAYCSGGKLHSLGITCPYGCEDGVCVENIVNDDLEYYPFLFPKEDVTIVIGSTASASSVVNGIDLLHALLKDGFHTQVGAAKLDTEIASPKNMNLISIGGPCGNHVTAELMGNPANCAEGFEEGKGWIILKNNNGKAQLIVAGYTRDDERTALEPLLDYQHFNLYGKELVVVRTGSGFKLYPPSDKECKDTDGGLDYYTRGTVTIREGDSVMAANDMCVDSGEQVITVSIGSTNTESGLTIEGVDANGEAFTLRVNGVAYSVEQGDTFTYSGTDIFVNDVFTYTIPVPGAAAELIIESSDSRTYLDEVYCKSDDSLGKKRYRCPDGCVNGACIIDQSISLEILSPKSGSTVSGITTVKASASSIYKPSRMTLEIIPECNGAECMVTPIITFEKCAVSAQISECEEGQPCPLPEYTMECAYQWNADGYMGRNVNLKVDAYDAGGNHASISQPVYVLGSSCIEEGQQGNAFSRDKCCAGLSQIANSYPSGDQCIQYRDGSFRCTYCGNGVCGNGENRCNCEQDCGSQTCSDSDGGSNYYVKGVITLTDSGASYSVEDVCVIANPITLGVGESNGAIEVIDANTEEGKANLLVGGEADSVSIGETLIGRTVGVYVNDLFTSNIPTPSAQVEVYVLGGSYLLEHYCTGQGSYLTELYKCENGCEDGACKVVGCDYPEMGVCLENGECFWDQERDKCFPLAGKMGCSEEDDGKDIYNRGHTFGFQINPIDDENARIRTGGRDVCISENALREHYCKDYYYIAQSTVTCEAGCENGACKQVTTQCIGEGGSIPVIPNAPKCCEGLELIPPLEGIVGSQGICTAKCGNGNCDPKESSFNCPEDCGTSCEGSGGYCVHWQESCKEGYFQSGPMDCPHGRSAACCLPRVEPEPVCGGCIHEDVCLPIGTRLRIDGEASFCGIGNQFELQFEAEEDCQNSYECTSNVCVDGECMSGSLFRKILGWFIELFS